jgi:hypothetical protein
MVLAYLENSKKIEENEISNQWEEVTNRLQIGFNSYKNWSSDERRHSKGRES